MLICMTDTKTCKAGVFYVFSKHLRRPQLLNPIYTSVCRHYATYLNTKKKFASCWNSRRTAFLAA